MFSIWSFSLKISFFILRCFIPFFNSKGMKDMIDLLNYDSYPSRDLAVLRLTTHLDCEEGWEKKRDKYYLLFG